MVSLSNWRLGFLLLCLMLLFFRFPTCHIRYLHPIGSRRKGAKGDPAWRGSGEERRSKRSDAV